MTAIAEVRIVHRFFQGDSAEDAELVDVSGSLLDVGGPLNSSDVVWTDDVGADALGGHSGGFLDD